LFTVEGLRELDRLRREGTGTGEAPGLNELAGIFRVAPREVNLALDALLGRSPEDAYASLLERHGSRTASAARRSSGGGATRPRGLKRFLKTMFREW
jgi:hypothetical protein